MADKVVKDKKILILDAGSMGYNWLFAPYGEIENCNYTTGKKFSQRELKKYTFIVFTGGADIDPSRYNQERDPTTHFNQERDAFEFAIAEQALKAKVPMIGICRGAQFACVFSGGQLIQDGPKHTGGQRSRHMAEVVREKLGVLVSSDHHQFMDPAGVKHQTLMRAYDQSYEAVWFPETKFLAVQYHPEWMSVGERGYRVFAALVQDFVLNNGTDELRVACNMFRAEITAGQQPQLPAPAANGESYMDKGNYYQQDKRKKRESLAGRPELTLC